MSGKTIARQSASGKSPRSYRANPRRKTYGWSELRPGQRSSILLRICCALVMASAMAHSRAGHDLTPISFSFGAARIVAAKRIAYFRCLTGQSFFIFPLYRSPRVVKQQRGGACRGAAISGGFSLRLAADDTFPEDDGWPPVPGGCRGDQRSACSLGSASMGRRCR